MTIAPYLTIMVGELVVARLIFHAISLVSLAKITGNTIKFLVQKKLYLEH